MEKFENFSEIATIKFSYSYLRELHDNDEYYQEIAQKFTKKYTKK